MKYHGIASSSMHGARRGGAGKLSPETEKIVLEKWCYFPEVYKMTKVLEGGIENG